MQRLSGTVRLFSLPRFLQKAAPGLSFVPVLTAVRRISIFKMGQNAAKSLNTPAPDFELPNQNGQKVKLSDFKGKRNVVLYFYPKDETPGCTKQACSFRDNMAQLSKLDAEVMGISSDSVDKHKAFAEHHGLTFTLLADTEQAVRKLYQVPSTAGMLPGRVTYVVGKDGLIKHVFDSQMAVQQHVKEAQTALEKLAAAESAPAASAPAAAAPAAEQKQ